MVRRPLVVMVIMRTVMVNPDSGVSLSKVSVVSYTGTIYVVETPLCFFMKKCCVDQIVIHDRLTIELLYLMHLKIHLL